MKYGGKWAGNPLDDKGSPPLKKDISYTRCAVAGLLVLCRLVSYNIQILRNQNVNNSQPLTKYLSYTPYKQKVGH